MADRDKILNYFKAGGDGELAVRLLDLAEQAAGSNKFRVSDFLDPHGINVAEIVAANYPAVRLETYGGFPNAERQKAAFISEQFPVNPDFSIVCFSVSWDKRYYHLGHRDVLGAFMGLGCKRELIGDIVMTEDGAQFTADRNFNNYIAGNLDKIGSATVTIKEIDASELEARQEEVKIIKATVANLRLDAVAAAAYGVSRSRMADEIKNQNVKVNWQDASNGAKAVKEGDVFSFRGRGRAEFSKVNGKTKKGRYSVELKRFI